jgi:hypothetical protein
MFDKVDVNDLVRVWPVAGIWASGVTAKVVAVLDDETLVVDTGSTYHGVLTVTKHDSENRISERKALTWDYIY